MSSGVREAARSVRPYLPSLLGPSAAAEVDAQLAILLAAEDTNAEQKLRSVLEQRDATNEFLERVLDDAPDFRPPQAFSAATRGGFANLPGHQGPGPAADKFCCPHGDYVWYRLEVGVDVAHCPTHPECRLEPMSTE
jgi:hypothetical protein